MCNDLGESGVYVKSLKFIPNLCYKETFVLEIFIIIEVFKALEPKLKSSTNINIKTQTKQIIQCVLRLVVVFCFTCKALVFLFLFLF